MTTDPATKPTGPGEVEQGVVADLEAMGVIPKGRGTLRAMALKLARTIDARGDDEAASALAKAVDTLRQVMNQLMAVEGSDPDAYGKLGDILGTPDDGSPSVSPAFRYPAEPGTANRGTGNRKGRPRARSK